jgi:hypothetical protein
VAVAHANALRGASSDTDHTVRRRTADYSHYMCMDERLLSKSGKAVRRVKRVAENIFSEAISACLAI